MRRALFLIVGLVVVISAQEGSVADPREPADGLTNPAYFGTLKSTFFQAGMFRKDVVNLSGVGGDISLLNIKTVLGSNFLPLELGIYAYDNPVGVHNTMYSLSWGLAFGTHRFGVGYLDRYYFSGSGRVHHWSVGVLSRISRGLSWGVAYHQGAVLDTLYPVSGEPAIFGLLSDENGFRVGVAIRPYHEYLTLWGDVLFDGDAHRRDVLVGGEISPVAGVYIRGGYSAEREEFSFGLRVDLGHAGVAFSGKDAHNFTGGVFFSERRMKTFVPYHTRTIKLTISGSYPESPKLFGEKCFRRLSDALYSAVDDPSVQEILIKLDSPALTFAQYEELRRILERFKSRGGKIKIFAEKLGNGTTYLTSVADEVCLPPSGDIEFLGIGGELTYYRGLFDKIGVKADFIHIGDYKTAAEPYYADSMSPQMREELTKILSHIDTIIVSSIAESRGISADSVRAWMKNSPMSPQRGKDFGIITTIAYWDEFKDSVGWDRAEPITTYISEIDPVDVRWDEKPEIAVIPVEGAIVHGASSPPGFLTGRVAGDKTVVKLLEKAAGDPDVKGIIIRVDSPGGSAYASDLMWRSAVRAREHKPVWVSMGAYAASGGYYISAAGDSIFADNSTITGSIGVLGGKFAIGGLYQKLGLKKQAVYLSPNANIYSLVDTFTTQQRQLMRRFMEDSYNLFKKRVLAGRKNLTPDSLEALAQGKVHTGTAAVENGLVDDIAGISEVERRLARHLKLKPGEYKIRHYSPYEAFDWFELAKKFVSVVSGETDFANIFLPYDEEKVWFIVPYYIKLK